MPRKRDAIAREGFVEGSARRIFQAEERVGWARGWWVALSGIGTIWADAVEFLNVAQ